MDISSSDLVAGVALLVSTFGIIYGRRQKARSRFSSAVSYRGNLSSTHEKYCRLLFDTEDRHRADYASLTQAANESLSRIVKLFDRYDIRRTSDRRLHYLIHEASEMLYYAFKGQLTWNSGLNIADRIGKLVRLEDNLKPSETLFDGVDPHLFERRYYNDPTRSEESVLLRDKYFCSLVEQLQARLDPENRVPLLKDVKESLKNFKKEFEAVGPGFADSARSLNKVIGISEQEQRELAAFPELKRRLEAEQYRLTTLSEMWFMDIADEHMDRYGFYVSFCIYFCTILHVVRGVHSWGWRFAGR